MLLYIQKGKDQIWEAVNLCFNNRQYFDFFFVNFTLLFHFVEKSDWFMWNSHLKNSVSATNLHSKLPIIPTSTLCSTLWYLLSISDDTLSQQSAPEWWSQFTGGGRRRCDLTQGTFLSVSISLFHNLSDRRPINTARPSDNCCVVYSSWPLTLHSFFSGAHSAA